MIDLWRRRVATLQQWCDRWATAGWRDRWATAGWRDRWATAQPWLSTGCRLVVGVVWIAAGWSKSGDLAESGRAVAAYRILPYDAATFLGAMLPLVEIALGLLLVVGLASRLGGVVSAVLLVAFTAGIIAAWSRGLRIDCGCFGGGGDLSATEDPGYALEVARDMGLLALSAFLAIFPRSRLSLDSRLMADGGFRR